MIKIYSIRQNEAVIPFRINEKNSFEAWFNNGDVLGISGMITRATYRTTNAIEQAAIESSELFRKKVIRLESAIQTEADRKLMERVAKVDKEAEKREEDRKACTTITDCVRWVEKYYPEERKANYITSDKLVIWCVTNKVDFPNCEQLVEKRENLQ